tara:strand:- start:320 stop:499 length:180 start_codon:yes stop_codon:yes gene_type:complete
MLEKTVTTDSTLNLQKAAVKLTLPVIEVTSYTASNEDLNSAIKTRLLHVVSQIIDKHLE